MPSTWVSRPIVRLGEFTPVEGVHLVRSDNAQLLARWNDAHNVVEVIDPTTVQWLSLPKTIPPRVRSLESIVARHIASHRTDVAILGDSYWSDISLELLDMGQAEVLTTIGEGINDWGPAHEKLKSWWGGWSRAYRGAETFQVRGNWAVKNVVFSPNSTMVAIERTASYVDAESEEWTDSPIEIWKLAGDRADLVGILQVDPAPNKDSKVMGFHREGRHVVLRNGDVWDIASERLDPDASRTFPAGLGFVIRSGHLTGEYSRHLTPDEIHPYTMGRLADDSLRITIPLSEIAEDPVLRYEATVGKCKCTWSIDRSLFAMHLDRDPLVQVFEVETGRLLSTLDCSQQFSRDSIGHRLRFSNDGQLLLVGGEHGWAAVWNWKEGRHIQTINGRGPGDGVMVFSPDGSLLAERTSQSGPLKVWSVQTGQVIFESHVAGFGGVGFSPDGSWLVASSGFDIQPPIRIWGPQTEASL